MKLNTVILCLVFCIANHATCAEFSHLPRLFEGNHPMGFDASATDVSADGSVVVGRSLFTWWNHPFIIGSAMADSLASRWFQNDESVLQIGPYGNAPSGRFQSGANAISGDGNTVVGWLRNDLREIPDRAFRWVEGNSIDDAMLLGVLERDDTTSVATDVDGNGDVVVGWSGIDDAKRQGFIWTPQGEMVGLGFLEGDTWSEATGVSSNGETVVGVSRQSPDGQGRAFVWSQSLGMTALPSLSSTLSASSRAEAVADNGRVIVGTSVSDSDVSVPTIWQQNDDGDWRVDTLHTGRGTALDVSEDGRRIVGTFGADYLRSRAFLWDEENGFADLNDVASNQEGLADVVSEWTLSQAHGISADGNTIVGEGFLGFFQVNAWVVDLDEQQAVFGDFDRDVDITSYDIDLLSRSIQAGVMDVQFDVNNDGVVSEHDREYWVRDVAATHFGDANLDGEFNSSDLITALSAGTYETDDDAGWASGDFDGSGRFNSGDLILALADGGYEAGPRPAAVPEPTTAISFLSVLIALAGVSRTRQRRV